MAHQPSGAVFERPRDSGVEESKSFDSPNDLPAQPRVPLGAMSPNRPAILRRRSGKQRSASRTRKIVRYREQSRVQEVVEERQRAEKAGRAYSQPVGVYVGPPHKDARDENPGKLLPSAPPLLSPFWFFLVLPGAPSTFGFPRRFCFSGSKQ